MFIYEGDPLKCNYLLEGRPLVVQASLTRLVFYKHICIRVLAALCERFLSEFFLKTLNMIAHFMMGDLQAHLPTLC